MWYGIGRVILGPFDLFGLIGAGLCVVVGTSADDAASSIACMRASEINDFATGWSMIVGFELV